MTADQWLLGVILKQHRTHLPGFKDAARKNLTKCRENAAIKVQDKEGVNLMVCIKLLVIVRDLMMHSIDIIRLLQICKSSVSATREKENDNKTGQWLELNVCSDRTWWALIYYSWLTAT